MNNSDRKRAQQIDCILLTRIAASINWTCLMDSQQNMTICNRHILQLFTGKTVCSGHEICLFLLWHPKPMQSICMLSHVPSSKIYILFPSALCCKDLTVPCLDCSLRKERFRQHHACATTRFSLTQRNVKRNLK